MVVDIKFLPEFGNIPPEVVPDNDIGHLWWNRPRFGYYQVDVFCWSYVEYGVPTVTYGRLFAISSGSTSPAGRSSISISSPRIVRGANL